MELTGWSHLSASGSEGPDSQSPRERGRSGSVRSLGRPKSEGWDGGKKASGHAEGGSRPCGVEELGLWESKGHDGEKQADCWAKRGRRSVFPFSHFQSKFQI